MNHPVLVVGAGPVGMTAALAVRAHGLPVTVLEAEREGRERPGSRAIFLHRESLEHLESIRRGARMAAGAQRASSGRPRRRTTARISCTSGRIRLRITTRLPHSTNLSQVEIERVLLDACTAAGITFAWEQHLESCESSSDGVLLRTTSGDEWRSSYVIGADGARSVVRSSAGIDLEGPRIEDAFVIVDVAEDDEHPMLPERVYYYEHPAVGGPQRPARAVRRWDPCRPPAPPRRRPGAVQRPRQSEGVDRTRAPRQLRRSGDLGVDLPVPPSSGIGVHRRASTVCLVGEAAHLFAPFGARGLNSGVPDALVAARSIRAALDGDARCDRSLRGNAARGGDLQP